jgi:hypothetical protein
VKVIMVGSGTKDPADAGPVINGTVNTDLQKKVIDPLPQQLRRNVGLWRVEHPGRAIRRVPVGWRGAEPQWRRV